MTSEGTRSAAHAHPCGSGENSVSRSRPSATERGTKDAPNSLLVNEARIAIHTRTHSLTEAAQRLPEPGLRSLSAGTFRLAKPGPFL